MNSNPMFSHLRKCKTKINLPECMNMYGRHTSCLVDRPKSLRQQCLSPGAGLSFSQGIFEDVFLFRRVGYVIVPWRVTTTIQFFF